tara:strand:- start:1219 stop:1920 length:702 start_codon:yes stop_codon:yes gene_type:complete
MINLSPMTEFWGNKPSILYDSEYIFEVFPHKTFDVNRKLNSLLRLSIYFAVITYLLDKTKINLMLVPLIVALLTYFIRRRVRDKPNKLEIKNRMLNGELHGPMLKEMEKECRLPTDENPFMNPMITDYGTKNLKKPICDYYNNKTIHKMVDDKFIDGLYQDVNDIFGKNNSQREFYTVPVTTLPNDQGNFAKWLYATPPSCKEGNALQCSANMRGYEPQLEDINRGDENSSKN